MLQLRCNYNLDLNVNYDILEREMKSANQYSEEDVKELEGVFQNIYQVLFMKAFHSYEEMEDGSYRSLESSFKERVEPVLDVLFQQLNECEAFRAFYDAYSKIDTTTATVAMAMAGAGAKTEETKGEGDNVKGEGEGEGENWEVDPSVYFVGLFNFDHFPKMHRIIVGVFRHHMWDEESANAILAREQQIHTSRFTPSHASS